MTASLGIVATATTVPICHACRGTRKVWIEQGGRHLPVQAVCACVAGTLEACEARIAGLERLLLEHLGVDTALLGGG